VVRVGLVAQELKTDKQKRDKMTTPREKSPLRKQTIPGALREQVWIGYMGRVFEGKCRTPWCTTNITVYDFQVGHNIPESKGGTLDIENLVPICAKCNLSCGDRYTFTEWAKLSKPKRIPTWKRYLCCMKPHKKGNVVKNWNLNPSGSVQSSSATTQ